MRHADPERGIIVGSPVALLDRHRREVFVIERAGIDGGVVAEFNATVGVLDDLGVVGHLAESNGSVELKTYQHASSN